MSTTETGQHSGGRRRQAQRSAPPPKTGTVLQLIARRVHFLAGIVVAPFLAVVALTGLIYAFSPEIHADLYRSDLFAHPTGGAPHPVSEQVRAALTAHPELKLKAVITAASPDRTTRVVLSVPGQTGSPDRTVYVDPYTDYISGELATVDNRLPANTWLRQLHSNLQLGKPGRIYSELAASWVPPLVVGGLALWFARSRRKRRVREFVLPAIKGKKGRLRLRSVHGSLGLWVTAGLLVAGVTGLAMSQFAGGRADATVDPIHLRAPTLVAAPVPVPPQARPIGIDEALAIAESAGLDGELSVVPPSGQSMPFTVTEITEGLPIQRDAITINPYTADVTERISWHDYSVLAKLSILGTEFHTGSLFGLANQIVVALVAAATLVLIVLGYRMWWIRNPYRGRWASLPGPLWRQLPRPALIVTLLAIGAMAWVLPVFGASLLAFLILDALLRWFMRRRKPVSAVTAWKPEPAGRES